MKCCSDIINHIRAIEVANISFNNAYSGLFMKNNILTEEENRNDNRNIYHLTY